MSPRYFFKVFALPLWVLGLSLASADVRGISGEIDFNLNSTSYGKLTPVGLALGGTIPSANLHVTGNAIITGQLGIGTSAPTSNLQVSGTLGFSFGSTSASSNLGRDSFVLADSSAGNINLKLPYASTVPGYMVTIKNVGSANTVTVSHGGLLDGQPTSIHLTSGNGIYPYVSLISSGNEYYTLDYGPTTINTSISLDKVTNCVVWLDASDASTVTVNGSGNVTAWADKSGRGLSFQQATVGLQPHVTTAWKNGKNAVTFDKVVQYLDSTSRLEYSAAGFTFFCVYDNCTDLQPSGNTEGNSTLFALYEIPMANPSFWFVTKANGQLYANTQHSGEVTVTDLFLSGIPRYTPYLTTIWFSQALSKKYFSNSNGSSGSSTSANHSLVLNASSSKGRVGTQKTSSSYELYGRSFSGNVGEILLYDRKLEDAEISVIQTYLKAKWAL